MNQKQHTDADDLVGEFVPIDSSQSEDDQHKLGYAINYVPKGRRPRYSYNSDPGGLPESTICSDCLSYVHSTWEEASKLLDTSNVYWIVLFVFLTSLCVGIIFYSTYHEWEFSTSFYFASQALLGNMYGVPEEPDHISQAFTICYYLWGNILIVVFQLVASKKRAKPTQIDIEINLTEGAIYDKTDKVRKPTTCASCLFAMGRILYEKASSRYAVMVLAVLWIFLGTAFGYVYEKWTFLKSLYFAVGAMSASGFPIPICENGKTPYAVSVM